MEKETRTEKKEVKITWDGKQMKVGIPAEFVERLKINSESDTIVWVLAEIDGGYILSGNLRRNEKKN